MIVRVYKERNVDINLEAIVNNINEFIESVKFVTGKNTYIARTEELNMLESFSELSTEILDESKNDSVSVFISDKKYDDNYFFHDSNNKFIISLANWDLYTTYSKNTGIVYMLTDILALYMDSNFRHHDDGVKDCIYNFGWTKTDIHDGIKSSVICDECQQRVIGSDGTKKELLLQDIVHLLEEIKKSNSYNDIVKYWTFKKNHKAKLFISYAHKDRMFLDEFKEYINVFERKGLVERWDDNELIGGEKWNKEIQDRINTSDIFIFLLSSTSLASDYINDKELKEAFILNDMEEAYVVPIIIKECLWKMTEFQTFHTLPLDSKAVNSWDRREEAWTTVAEELKRVIDKVIEAKQSSEEEYKSSIDKEDTQKINKITEPIDDENIVLKFLQYYSRWWFNATRIVNWGSERKGFERLKEISQYNLDRILLKLEKDNKVVSKPSSKNRNKFLYKIEKDK